MARCTSDFPHNFIEFLRGNPLEFFLAGISPSIFIYRVVLPLGNRCTLFVVMILATFICISEMFLYVWFQVRQAFRDSRRNTAPPV